MNIEIPNKNEVQLAVIELFDKVNKHEKEWLLSGLVPIDRKLSQGFNVITYVVEYEMQELCDFLNQFNAFKDNCKNEQEVLRVKILNYCHIMEADFAYLVIWNLLRILNKQKSMWTFYNCDENGDPIKNKKDGYSVLRFPLEKINAIKIIADKIDLGIGNILLKLWKSELRNSFSHSQYYWMGNTFVTSKGLSPFSRRDSDLSNHYTISEDQIEELYSCVQGYLHIFIDLYKVIIKQFKDGKPHKIHDGFIYWESKLSEWRWHNEKAI